MLHAAGSAVIKLRLAARRRRPQPRQTTRRPSCCGTQSRAPTRVIAETLIPRTRPPARVAVPACAPSPDEDIPTSVRSAWAAVSAGALVLLLGFAPQHSSHRYLSRLRFPLGQKLEQHFRRERTRVLEFAILFPVRPYIHMDDFIARHDRCEIGPMKCQIEHVAVVAPVRSKNQQDALMFFRGFFFRLLNLSARVRTRRVRILLHVGRLLEVRSIRSFGADQPPLLALLPPSLSIGHVHGLAIRPCLHLSLKDDALSAGPLLD